MKKIVLFVLITLCVACKQDGQGSNFQDVFVRGKEVLITEGYSDIILTGSWPKNDQNFNARTNFQAKDADCNIVEGYFIEENGKITTYIQKRDIKL